MPTKKRHARFRTRIRAVVAKHGGTLERFAELIGAQRHTTVSRWTSGKGLPNGEYLQRIGERLNVSLDWLVVGTTPDEDSTVVYRGQGAGRRSFQQDLVTELRSGAPDDVQDTINRLTIDTDAVLATAREQLFAEARFWSQEIASLSRLQIPGEIDRWLRGSKTDTERYKARGDHLRVLDERAPALARGVREEVRRKGRYLRP